MNRLWDPPTQIQASAFRSAARPSWAIAQRCSQAGVRYAAANPAAPLPAARRSATPSNHDGRLQRKPEPKQFLRLAQHENQMRVDKTS